MKTKFAFIFTLLFMSLPAYSEEETENDLIDRLTADTGTAAAQLIKPSIEAFSTRIAKALMKRKPSLPPEAEAAIRSEIAAYLYDQFIASEEINNLKYKVYKKYFTKDELSELVEFYESPLGEKLRSTMPKMIAEIQGHSAAVVSEIFEHMQADMPQRLNRLMRENGW
jgi:hypothetical protein